MDINDGDISEMNNQSVRSAVESPVSATDLLQMIVNLKQEFESQKEQLEILSERIDRFNDNLKLLVKELVKAEYIKLGERRKLLQRNITAVESLINILMKKRMLTRRELLTEIKKLRKIESSE